MGQWKIFFWPHTLFLNIKLFKNLLTFQTILFLNKFINILKLLLKIVFLIALNNFEKNFAKLLKI